MTCQTLNRIPMKRTTRRLLTPTRTPSRHGETVQAIKTEATRKLSGKYIALRRGYYQVLSFASVPKERKPTRSFETMRNRSAALFV